jgi:hypothetical protein
MSEVNKANYLYATSKKQVQEFEFCWGTTVLLKDLKLCKCIYLEWLNPALPYLDNWVTVVRLGMTSGSSEYTFDIKGTDMVAF